MSLVEWVDLIAAAAVAGLTAHRLHDRKRLATFVSSLGDLPAEPAQRAIEVAGRLARGARGREDPPFLFSWFAPLGATVTGILRHGACCSGYSRLYILALGDLGFPASQVTVYHRSRQARHCLVEVRLPSGSLIADPVYALVYRSADGRALGLEDLQAGTEVRCEPIGANRRAGYPPNGYYDFDYSLTKTANWTKSWPRRVTYALLRRVTGGGVDRLRVPAWLEWPQHLLIVAIAGLVTLAHLTTLLDN